jgi:hypothetical protein
VAPLVVTRWQSRRLRAACDLSGSALRVPAPGRQEQGGREPSAGSLFWRPIPREPLPFRESRYHSVRAATMVAICLTAVGVDQKSIDEGDQSPKSMRLKFGEERSGSAFAQNGRISRRKMFAVTGPTP